MNKKPQEPKRDWGFYAVTPRVVRTQYKELSHAEKWLYTCLKDLCGDKGSCFRSLRSLSEETDISIASLSKMIPHLHNAGLIHAEKKRRSKSGKEVWHITIADIWQENAKYSKDCSIFEQSHEGNSEVVQKLNKNTADCSENEQGVELGCSNFSDRRINSKNKDTEEGMNGTDSTNSDIIPSSTPSLSSLSTEDLVAEIHRREHEQLTSSESSQDETPSLIANTPIEPITIRNEPPVSPMPDLPSKSTQRTTEPLDPDTPGIQRIDGYWQQLGFISKPSAKEHWRTLSKHIKSFEQFDSLYKHTQLALKDKADSRVHPGNLVDHLNGWKQKQAPPPEQPIQGKPYGRDLGSEMRKLREQYIGK